MAEFRVVIMNTGLAPNYLEREVLEPIGARVIVAERDCNTEDQVIVFARDADAVFVREEPVTTRVIESLDRVKIYARYGVGVDNVDIEAARKRKIYVTNVPGYGTEDVSDHAMALMLACIRTLPARDRNVRKGIFETDISAEIHRTTGKTLGIIGYGLIARAFHRKWKGFLPNRTLVYDPLVDAEEIDALGGEKTDLDTLLRESDYISIHAPLTLENRHMIDAAALDKMKPAAVIVNTARGAIIDTLALADALERGRIFAAGIDVFEIEPLPPDHPLAALPNVILTPHQAWYSKESRREIQTRAAAEIRRVLTGEKPKHWVNPW